MRLATASRRFPGADNYERWWLAPSVSGPSTTPLPSTQMPRSAICLVSTITGDPSGQPRGHTWTGGKRRSYSE